jgi:hypothetical protein
VGLARDLILGNDADRRIARPLVSKCSIGGNFRAHAMEGVSVQVWNRSWSLSWARELTKLGHQVQLMPAKDVKAYVKRNRRRGDLRGRTTSDHAFCAGQIGRTAEPVDAASDAGSFTATADQLINALRAHMAELGIMAAQDARLPVDVQPCIRRPQAKAPEDGFASGTMSADADRAASRLDRA